MLRALMVLVALGVVGTANAQTFPADVPRLPDFTASCKEGDSLGFIWKEDTWKPTTFTLNEYIVRRVTGIKTGLQPDGSDNLCIEAKEDSAIPPYASRWGCYAVYPRGERPVFRYCAEVYGKQAGKWALREIDCDAELGPSFQFVPNGRFVRGDVGANVSPKPNETLALSVGACGVLK